MDDPLRPSTAAARSRRHLILARMARAVEPPPRSYRVEHCEGGAVRMLGTLAGVRPHHRALDPFLSGLRRAGAGGELRLVDARTGAVAARRWVRSAAGLGPE